MKKMLALLMILPLIAPSVIAMNSVVTRPYPLKAPQVLTTVDWWPMFYHDPARTGNSSSPAPPINQTRWNHTVGDWIESSPTLVDGKAYVTTINWWKGHIHCIDLYNGNYLWNYTINDQLYSSPAVNNGKLYVASLNGRFLCLNASTGQEIYNMLLDTDILIQSSPVVDGNRVYISCTNEYPATNRSKLFCLYTENGSVVWYNRTYNARDITPAVVDGKVYGAGADNHLTCFDALTGEMLWQSDELVTTSQPVVVNGNVFGANDTSVYCVHNGETVWDFPLNPGFLVASSLAEGSGRLFIGALNPYASIPGMIHCINIDTGQALWNYSSQVNGEYNAKPTIASNHLYISEDTGVGMDRRARICCFDAPTGTLISTRYVNSASTNYVYGTLSIADGLLVLGSTEMDATTVWGGIYCYGTVSVPKPVLNITQISGGKALTIKIANQGDTDATGIVGELNITGGLFIHQGEYSFPVTIPAGDTSNVTVPLFGVGLGILKAVPQLSVDVSCNEGSSASARQQFRIFLMRITIVVDS
jgi:outer membrane protein assembly factor BamB